MSESVILQHNSTGAIISAHEECWRIGNIVRPQSREKYTVLGMGPDPVGPCAYVHCNH